MRLECENVGELIVMVTRYLQMEGIRRCTQFEE